MNKPLLVGQAPARSMKPGARAFDGSSSKARLERFLEIDNLFEYFDTVNLIEEFPGKADDGKYDLFDASEARAGARRVQKEIIAPRGYNRVFCAGRQVARAFGFPIMTAYFQFEVLTVVTDETTHAVDMCVIPHPGGTNRWWNEPANRADARRFFRYELRMRHLV